MKNFLACKIFTFCFCNLLGNKISESIIIEVAKFNEGLGIYIKLDMIDFLYQKG